MLSLRCDNNPKFQHGRQRKQRYAKIAHQDKAQGDEERVSVHLLGLLPRGTPQLRVPEALPFAGDGRQGRVSECRRHAPSRGRPQSPAARVEETAARQQAAHAGKSTAKQPYPVGVVRAVQGDTAEPWRERPLRDRPAPGHHSRHGTRRHGTQGGRQGLLLVVHGIPENGLQDGKRPAPQIKNRVQPPMYLDNGTQCRSPRGCHPVQPDGPPLTPRTGEDEQREERVPDY